jgi:gas vesicle protein
MDRQPPSSGNNGLVIGLIAGGMIGVGLALVFAPRLRSELRRRLTESANDLNQRYQEVTTRVTGVVDDMAARGQAVRDEVADAVGRGARQVEQIAMASKTGRATKQS